MKLKEILIGAVAVVLVALVAIGATLAYLTATDEVTNVMTVGDVDIELLEYERVDAKTKGDEAAVQEFVDDKLLMPPMLADGFDYASPDATIKWDADKDGNAIKPGYTSNIWDPEKISRVGDKMVFVKNTGKYVDAYVRLYFAFEAGNYTSFTRFKNMIHLNLNETEWTWEWNKDLADIHGTKYFIACATYYKAISPDEITAISLSQIALDPTATNGDAIAFGDKYDILVVGQAIQSGAFADAKQALDEGFGTEPPFRGIEFTKSVNLKTALHYLDGVESEENKITSKVSSITFGLSADHVADISGAGGVPTANLANEAEFAAYTYYVPNGDNYDVYVLADEGKVYAPTSCSDLFRGMTSLTTVDAANLDVSKTTSMSSMFNGCVNLQTVNTGGWVVDNVGSMYATFYNCKKLQSIDVSTWNTGNVIDMYAMFYQCNNLSAVDVSNWNVSKVTDMRSMFRGCSILKSIDVSTWDVSNVTKTASMFNSCYELQNIDVSNWTVSKITDMSSMFQDCKTLTALEVSEWNTAVVKNISAMFSGCSNLASIDVSNWTVDNVTEMNSMFKNCPKLASPMNLSGWNVGKVTSMMLMFDGCTSLTELNVSDWNVSNATSLRGIFKNCNLLTELEVAGWSVSEKNTSLLETFYGCSNLKQLDLSSWNVSGVTNMTLTFAACSSLTSLNVSTWKLNEVATITLSDMFRGCSSLASLNVSDWNVNKVTSMTSLFQNCSALTSLDVSGWSVGSVTAMNNMFLNCKKLTALDLNGWNTAEVKHARNMFRGCSELVTIYVGDGWEMSQIPEENVDKGTGEKSSALMFFECPKLVGEKGTTYNKNNVDKTYAIIDGKDGNPGYLTQGPAPANP